jgi:hypothetical protein
VLRRRHVPNGCYLQPSGSPFGRADNRRPGDPPVWR